MQSKIYFGSWFLSFQPIRVGEYGRTEQFIVTRGQTVEGEDKRRGGRGNMYLCSNLSQLPSFMLPGPQPMGWYQPHWKQSDCLPSLITDIARPLLTYLLVTCPSNRVINQDWLTQQSTVISDCLWQYFPFGKSLYEPSSMRIQNYLFITCTCQSLSDSILNTYSRACHQ